MYFIKKIYTTFFIPIWKHKINLHYKGDRSKSSVKNLENKNLKTVITLI